MQCRNVCGDSMADREFSTIGHERLNNPLLQIRDRDEFIEHKLAELHDEPPYFRRMEQLNLEGAGPAPRVIAPRPLSPEEAFETRGDTVILDVRGVTAFLGAHIPKSLAIPDDMLSAFAGWLFCGSPSGARHHRGNRGGRGGSSACSHRLR